MREGNVDEQGTRPLGALGAASSAISQSASVSSSHQATDTPQRPAAVLTDVPQQGFDLGESDAPYRAAFAAASIGMALVTPDGRFLTVNPALCTILGYAEADLLTLTLPDITHDADRENDRELARQLVVGEIDAYQIEKR